jgi:hypothetical protein
MLPRGQARRPAAAAGALRRSELHERVELDQGVGVAVAEELARGRARKGDREDGADLEVELLVEARAPGGVGVELAREAAARERDAAVAARVEAEVVEGGADGQLALLEPRPLGPERQVQRVGALVAVVEQVLAGDLALEPEIRSVDPPLRQVRGVNTFRT